MPTTPKSGCAGEAETEDARLSVLLSLPFFVLCGLVVIAISLEKPWLLGFLTATSPVWDDMASRVVDFDLTQKLVAFYMLLIKVNRVSSLNLSDGFL